MKKIFENILGEENVLKDEAMSRHTTFRIGGNAEYFLTPETPEQLTMLLHELKRAGMPYFILGNGSNLLVSDGGIDGAVISLYKKMADIRCENTEIYAQCGALLSRIAAVALKNELTGFEFASGIPGSLGGAVCMNAGAYGSEMSGVIKSVEYMDADGNTGVRYAEECEFGYRKSIFAIRGEIVLGCTLALEKGSATEIRAKMNELTEKRVSKQPLDKPSAGSVFKRPEGHFAGGLIEQAGLKGYTVGGAQVSEKHAGFIVNTGGATAADVLALIKHIQKTVFDMSGVMLEPEVKMIGRFDTEVEK